MFSIFTIIVKITDWHCLSNLLNIFLFFQMTGEYAFLCNWRQKSERLSNFTNVVLRCFSLFFFVFSFFLSSFTSHLSYFFFLHFLSFLSFATIRVLLDSHMAYKDRVPSFYCELERMAVWSIYKFVCSTVTSTYNKFKFNI